MWYDDSLSLSLKYQFAKEQQLAGVGMWALGYDEGHDELWGAIESQFFVSLLGDINSDGIINILDIISTVNLILSNEYDERCDMNADGILDVLDIINMVQLILNLDSF